MRKKILPIIICIIILSLGMFVCTACKKKPSGKPTDTLSINVESVELIIGDKYELTATYEGDAFGDIVYATENPSVAVVDEDGIIEAVAVGETKLTASKGSASDSITVKVGTGDMLPSLQFRYFKDLQNIKIAMGDEFDLSCFVIFNGNTYYDAVVDYSLSNDKVTVENGILKPQATGTCTVTAAATWRNCFGSTLAQLLTVTVENNIELYVNENTTVPNEEIILYTYPQVGSYVYDTEMEFVAKAFENGEQIGVDVEIVAGKEHVEYVAADKKIRAKKYGSAVVAISCVGSDGKRYEKLYDVNVKASIGDYDEVVDFSVLDGTLPLERIFGSADVEIVEAYDTNGSLQVAGNKVLGVAASLDLTPKTITVCTEQYGYNITVIPYTKIITKASDLEIFKISNTVANGTATVQSGLFDGYYILGNDIDVTDYIHQNGITGIDSFSSRWFESTGFKNCGLTGIFDGNGYTIRGLEINRHGLFGIINGGTVKNVAFENVSLSGSNCATLCWFALNATIENIYIHIGTLPNIWARTAVAASFVQSRINNMIVKVDNVLGDISSGAYGSFTGMNSNQEFENTAANVFTNVYIISATAATITSSTTVDGENRDCANKYVGIKRYDSVSDMTENKNYLGSESLPANDYSSFGDSGFWNTSSGIPVFGK